MCPQFHPFMDAKLCYVQYNNICKADNKRIGCRTAFCVCTWGHESPNGNMCGEMNVTRPRYQAVQQLSVYMHPLNNNK